MAMRIRSLPPASPQDSFFRGRRHPRAFRGRRAFFSAQTGLRVQAKAFTERNTVGGFFCRARQIYEFCAELLHARNWRKF